MPTNPLHRLVLWATRVMGSIVSASRSMHVSVPTLIRIVSLLCAAASMVLFVGSIVSLNNGGRGTLTFLIAYPPLFGAATIAWAVAASRPTPGWCSIASAAVAAPAMSLAAEYAVSWVLEGTDRIGLRLIEIGSWSLIAVLAVAVALFVSFLGHLTDRPRSAS